MAVRRRSGSRPCGIRTRAKKKTDPRENGGRGPVVYSWRDGDRTFIGSPCIDFRACWTPDFAVTPESPANTPDSQSEKLRNCVQNGLDGPRTGPSAAQNRPSCSASRSSGSARRGPAATPRRRRRTIALRRAPRVRVAVSGSAARRSGGGCSGAPERQQLGDAGEVFAQRLQHPRRVQRGGGVVDRVQPHRPRAEHPHLGLAVQAGDPGGVAAQQLGGEVARACRSRSARSARPGAAGTPGSSRSPPAGGRGCRAGGTSARCRSTPRPARARSPRAAGPAAARRAPRRACPARPRWRPGASPTNISSASALPDPNTTVLRVAASSGQRSQARARIRSSFSDSRRAAADCGWAAIAGMLALAGAAPRRARVAVGDDPAVSTPVRAPGAGAVRRGRGRRCPCRPTHRCGRGPRWWCSRR